MLHGVPNKREFLAKAFEQAGVLNLLEQVLSKRRAGLTVLTYHRIAEPAGDLFYDPVVSATPESFRKQINWLHNHFRLLTLAELIDHIEGGFRWNEPMLLLTFDDGYRDNFDVAVPILRESKAPACFFISSAFLESPRLPWWDHIAYVIKQTRIDRFILDRQPVGNRSPLEIDLRAMSRSTAIMMIIRAFLDDTIADECKFLDQLSERAMVEMDTTDLGRRLFMNWAHIQEMVSSSAGLTIGSHAHSHRQLAKLDADTQYHELVSSKRILEARLKLSIKALAYPYGWRGAYTAETKAKAAQAGYCLAFSSEEGINRFANFDRYGLKRLGVGSADSVALLRARSTLYAAFGSSFL